MREPIYFYEVCEGRQLGPDSPASVSALQLSKAMA